MLECFFYFFDGHEVGLLILNGGILDSNDNTVGTRTDWIDDLVFGGELEARSEHLPLTSSIDRVLFSDLSDLATSTICSSRLHHNILCSLILRF